MPDALTPALARRLGMPADLGPMTVMKGTSRMLANNAEMARAIQPVLRARTRRGGTQIGTIGGGA